MYVCMYNAYACMHACIALLQVACIHLFLLVYFRLSDRDQQLVQVKNASEQMKAQLSSKEESLGLVQAECIQLSQQLESLRYAENFHVICPFLAAGFYFESISP